MSSNNNASATIDLENLRQKYSNVLTQYKSSVADYINYLNANKKELVTIQGQAFNGTGSAGESSATTLQECVASCSNSKTCSGATFVSNECQIRTGDSPLMSSSENSYAIIPKGKQLLINVEKYNQQLLDINKQLTQKIKALEPLYDKTANEVKNKNQELLENYNELIQERENIMKMLNDYETLENQENNNQIKVTQNYYWYILLVILAFLMIFLLYKTFGTSKKPTFQYGNASTSNYML